MEAPETFYSQVENVCRELYIQSLKEIPPDIVEAIRQAAQRDTKEVGRRIFSHYLKSIDLGRSQNMIVCQDTGIPIYWVEIGGNLRMDGARLTQAIIKGTERATREHPLRSSIVSPITRENRQPSTGERIPIIHYDLVPDSDVLDILLMPQYCACCLGVTGGPAAMETLQIEELESVYWEDLMPECIWQFRFRGLGPLTVGIDTCGGNLQFEVQREAQQRAAELLRKLGAG